MRSEKQRDIALECLRMAVRINPDNALPLAVAFYTFVTHDPPSGRLRVTVDGVEEGPPPA